MNRNLPCSVDCLSTQGSFHLYGVNPFTPPPHPHPSSLPLPPSVCVPVLHPPFPSAAGSPSGSGAARGPAPFLPREVTHCGKGTRWQSGVSRTAALSPDHETEGVVGHSTHTNKIKLTFRRLKPMPWREFKRHRQLFRSSRLTARCSIQS